MTGFERLLDNLEARLATLDPNGAEAARLKFHLDVLRALPPGVGERIQRLLDEAKRQVEEHDRRE